MTTPRTRRRRRRPGRFGTRPVGAACATCPSPLRLHFHLDVNRDGVVDDDYTMNNVWEVGTGKLGAIILCNCDADGTNRRCDNLDNEINTAADNSDIAPLFIRKHPADEPQPAGWRAVIEVSVFEKDCIRIFGKDTATATEVLGPSRRSFELRTLDKNEWKYGMEATQFPGRMKRASTPRGVGPYGDNWDGYVTLKLTLFDATGAEKHSETARVRATPWVMFNHFDPTDKVLVVDTGDNGPFRGDLTAAAGVPVQTLSNGDRWMQDVIEPGFATLPQPAGTADPHLPAIIRTANDRAAWWGDDLDVVATNELLKRNSGFYEVLKPIDRTNLEPTKTEASSLDSFGNLECVPPFTHPTNRKEYKFGRIVYGRGGGDDMREEVREFLDAQKVQFPFTVDTSWLEVGHVDEVLSFLPDASAPKKFRLLLASPKRAVDILRCVVDTTLMFQGIRTGGTYYDRYPPEIPAPPKVSGVLAQTALMTIQDDLQKKIDEWRRVIKDAVGLEESEIIDLPILFRRVRAGKHIAFTAGSVNMLVVTQGPRTLAGTRTARLCIPKPFGPVVGGKCQFEADMETSLGPTGATFRFIDDFEDYHNGSGEIHCGTNSLRKAPMDRFWWEQPNI